MSAGARAGGGGAAGGAGYALGVLFLINFLNFFDRVIPAVVLEPIRKEFAASDTWLGAVNTAFTLVYAVAGVPLGRLADGRSRTRILAAGVFFWSLLTAASGMARGLVTLSLVRVGVGLGEASCAPAANSMIGDLYPSGRRARALGVFMLGLPFGSLAAFLGGGQLAQRYGWRLPFLLAAAPGAVLALVALRLRDPERGSQEAYEVDEGAGQGRPFYRVLAVPTVRWVALSGVTYNFATYAMGTFLPALIMRYHGLGVARAGSVSAVVLGLTGLVGLTAGGWAADRLHQRFARGRLALGAVGMLAAAPLLWLGLSRPRGDVALLTAFLALGWLLSFLYYVTVYASLQDVVPPRLRATTMSIYFFFQYVLGAAWGSTATGVLSDRFARQAMRSAGAPAMTDAFLALGLQRSMLAIVPLAIALTGVVLLVAANGFARDAERARGGPRP